MWKSVLSACLIASSYFGISSVAAAVETVKYGVVGPMTGPFAVMGDNWRQGLEAYLALHGDTFGGRKVEIIYRDTGGDASKAKQLVQELVVRDKVSLPRRVRSDARGRRSGAGRQPGQDTGLPLPHGLAVADDPIAVFCPHGPEHCDERRGRGGPGRSRTTRRPLMSPSPTMRRD